MLVKQEPRKTPEEIAKEAMAQLESEDKAKQAKTEDKVVDQATEQPKAQEESKDASASAKDETKKTEAPKAEEKPVEKTDDELLKAEDQNLTEPEKVRKDKLLEDELKRTKEKTQDRINELMNARSKDAEEFKKLKDELAELKKQIVPDKKDVVSELNKLEHDRRVKYLTEDATRPREERREMTKEELDEWYLEDPVTATEWIQSRTNRRFDERKYDEKQFLAKDKASEFITKQNESKARLLSKYPQINPDMNRVSQLKNSGKSDKEIFDTICQENEYFKLCNEIANSDSKYISEANGPELVMAEMEKRLSVKAPDQKTTKKVYTEEEVKQMIEEAKADESKRANAVDQGISSSAGKPGTFTNKNKYEAKVDDLSKNPEYKKHLDMFEKRGISRKDYAKQLEYREKVHADRIDKD